MMVVDTFQFAGEDDLLELRIRELEGLVERHVAIMGTHTQRGDVLEYQPPAGIARRGGVHFIRVPTADGTPFEREARQRAFVDELARNVPGAVYLHGDIDEIPRRRDVQAVLEQPKRLPMRLRGDLHQLRLDLWLPDEHGPNINLVSGRGDHADAKWHPFAGPTIAVGHHHVDRGTMSMRKDSYLPERLHSGWHLQWVMSPADCVRKLATFPHEEYYKAPYNTEEFWELCVRNTRDPFGRWLLQHKPIDGTFPRAVREQPERWAYLMCSAVPP